MTFTLFRTPAVSLTHEIQFFGEVLPGHDPATARKALQQLLKCSDETLARVFSGERVTLRKGLSTWQVEHYLTTLTGIGLKVVVEPPFAPTPDAAAAANSPAAASAQATSSAPDAAQVDTPVVVPPPPAEAGATTVTCPACGEVQPPRTLCRACSIDMPRYAAAARAAAAERQAPRPTSASAEMGYEEYGDAPLFALGMDGRFGRSAYLQSALLAFAAAMLLMPLMLRLGMPGIVLGLALMVALAVYGIRAGILRCHDLGFNGWWSLATIVPVVGVIAALALLLVPGQKQDNAWGPRRRPVGFPALIGGLVLAIASAGVMTRLTPDGLPDPRQLAGARKESHADEQAFLARYDTRRDHIVMYSLTTCGYCAEKREQFERMGVRFTEYMIDTDPAAEERLSAGLRQTGISGGVGTPIVEVNGKLLPNNPSLTVMLQFLRGPQG